MISQSLSACGHTVAPGSVPDSIHANLLLSGRSGEPVEFHIDRIRDGRALQHRTVRGYQGDDLIVHATVVASMPAAGVDWQRSGAPEVGAPDTSPDAQTPWAQGLGRGVFEIVHPVSDDEVAPPSHPLWIRSAFILPDDPWLHAAVRAFWSDFGMNWAARATHGRVDDEKVVSVSATHSVCFHRQTTTDRWHLLDVHTESLSGNQAFVDARLYDEAGGLSASVTQRVFIRRPGPARPS
jgi:acyl-CoA thioesterase-2